VLKNTTQTSAKQVVFTRKAKTSVNLQVLAIDFVVSAIKY